MNYDGGKNGAGVWQLLINQIPPHRVFVELFMGSGALLRRIRPAERNIGIELDARTVAAVQRELPAVDVLQIDAVKWLSSTPAAEDWFIYADPPYLLETRSYQRELIYRHEFHTAEQHSVLLDLLDRSVAMVAISGYGSRLYAERLRPPKWRRLDFTAGSRGGPRTESVWFNYGVPVELHDYRYLGEDRTDRQRIRRKLLRWQRRLEALPTLERAKLLAGLSSPAVSRDYARG